MKKSVVLALSAAFAAASHLAPMAAADDGSRLPQPNPAGSVLDGHLSEINDKGAYFAETPYAEQAASRAVGQIVNAGSLCTGSVIDSASRTLVVTAAHCLGKWQDGKRQISQGTRDSIAAGKSFFTPAFDGVAQEPAQRVPFGSWKIADAHVSETSGVDVAVLEIAPDDQGRKIQDVTGAFGIHPELQQGEVVQASLIGYPGPAPFNGKSQSVCVGNYTKYQGGGNSQIRRVEGERECWVGGGSSGGPFATTSSNPNLAGEIITVLHSGGGGNIAPVMGELVNAAEGDIPAEEKAEVAPVEPTTPTEPAAPTESTEPAAPAEQPTDAPQQPETQAPEAEKPGAQGAEQPAPAEPGEAPPAEPRVPEKGIDPAEVAPQPQAPEKGIDPATFHGAKS
ncbi:trypsin-like peptidase domain-containing protein [Corynebacterium mastitidis]